MELDELPIRPIISNINTTSYQLSKYLVQLLSPLSTPDYTVKCTSNLYLLTSPHNLPTFFQTIQVDTLIKQTYNLNGVKTNVPRCVKLKIFFYCAPKMRILVIIMNFVQKMLWERVRCWVQYSPVYLWWSQKANLSPAHLFAIRGR